MSHNFDISGLAIDATLSASFERDGIREPTPVQRAAIEPILAQRDVLVQSGTGTGKTLAYLLPLLQRAKEDPQFRFVVMAPSPELAVQILRVVEAYRDPSVGCAGLVGTGNIERQKDKLKKHPRAIVGTPGRVLELWLARKIKTAQVGTLVLDEVDEVLAPKIETPLAQICSRPEFKAQLIYASATLGPRAYAFADKFMKADRFKTIVTQAPMSETITHYVAALGENHASKEEAFMDLLQSMAMERVLVFVNKLFSVTHLYQYLTERGVKTLSLSSERNKQSREQALQALKASTVQVVVATDTAARGLDIKDLGWVVHFDAAREPESYVHRAGRVGRAGQPGNSVVLMAPREHRTVKQYQSTLGIEFTSL